MSATEPLQSTTPQSTNTYKDATTDTDTKASVRESLYNKTSQSISTDKDATTDTDTKAPVTESLHNTTSQSISTYKDATTDTGTKASVRESLFNKTSQSISTDKDATTDTDTKAPVTESLHNTTSQSISTYKDATTDTDTEAPTTESLHNKTSQSISTYKDATTDTDTEAPTTESLHNKTSQSISTYKDATTDTDTKAPTTESLHNTTSQSINTDKDGWLIPSIIEPWYFPTPTIEDLEADAYNIIHNCSTCEHKCGLRKPQRPSECYCDKACVQLGDCCLDYEESCLSGPNVTSKSYADILRSRKPRAAKCVEIRQEDGDKVTLMVVSSCGNEIMSTTDNATVNRCERPFLMNKNLTYVIPVMFRDVIYRNKYCAICNNPGENLTDMATAVDFPCSDYDYECEIKFNLSNFANLLQDNHRYTCRLVDECNAADVDPQFDFDYIRTTCQKYRAYIRFYPSYTYHSNPHCAICSGFDIGMFDTRCDSPYESQSLPPWFIEETFVRMTNFKLSNPETSNIVEPQNNTNNWCFGDRVFDHNNVVCPLTCPAGHVGLPDKRCARLNVTVPQMLSGKRNVRTYVVISTENKEFRHVDQEYIINDIGVDVVENSTRCKLCKAFKVWDNWDEVISNTSTCWFQETMSRNFGYVVDKVHRFIRKEEVKSRINIFVLNLGENDTSRSCLEGSPKIQSDLVFPSDETCLDKFGCTFQVDRTSRVYNITEVPVIMSWRNNRSANTGWAESSTALVCEPDIFSCDTVTFQAGEYIDMGESLVLYGGTSLEVVIRERNILRLDSNAIVLCASLLFNLNGIIGINHYDNNTKISVQVIVTLTGNFLSMACLAFTMITYCMFAEIRTRAGKCVMNLCGALFFAQLSFQVSDAFLPYSEACTAVAVFQHYMWLVVFLWMNVLAFDISCTFADLKPSSSVPNTSRLRAFALYAWGLPAVFVVVCLVFDLCTNLPFSYGSKNMCWIVNGRAVLYIFGSPVAAVITANAVLFVRTVVALRRTMSTASRARPPKQQRSTFVIYLRLTSLMGFMWLFGFLANVDVLSFLYYPFILCNTLQGVFICVSFTLTPTVRRLWRDLRSRNRNRKEISTSSTATPSEICEVRL